MRAGTRGPFRRAALLLAVGLSLLAEGSRAETASPAELAMAAGQADKARALAAAQLQANPQDSAAHAVLATLALQDQRAGAARRQAAQAFASGQTPHQRFVAARIAARAAHGQGRPLVAQYWLRRAVDTAPTAPARQATISDFQTLRRVSPVQLSFDAALLPSTNVNQGAESRVLSVDGLPTFFVFDPASMALPGAEVRLGASLRQRIAGSPQNGTDATLRLSQTAVYLSDRARQIAPMARSGDFATAGIDLGLSRHARISPRLQVRAAATLGKTWLAAEPYSERLRLEAGLTRFATPLQQTGLTFSAERQWRSGQTAPATAFVLDGTVQRLLPSGNTIGLRLSASTTRSDNVNQENTALSAEGIYALGAEIAGLRLSGSLGLSHRDYPVLFGGAFGPSGREDTTLSGAVSLTLTGLETWGFEPVLSLQGKRSLSNVSLYDTSTLGLGLQIRSAF